MCLPPPSTIANGALAVALIEDLNITSMMTVPTIMEDMTSLDDFDHAARVLSRLEFVAVGGGGMKESISRKLHSRGVKLLNHFGATELGALAPIFRPGPDYDYRYLRFRRDMGLKLVTLDPADHGERACKIVGYPFAWDSTFELQDRLQYNPERPRSEVRILGRNDDLIVLATGEKVLPHTLEQSLEQDPLVRRAVAFGAGQSEIGVLIEPKIEVVDKADFVERVWKATQKVNEQLDGHAQISTKAAILLKPEVKAIPLSDKGVPQRKEVYATFATEIKSIYEALEAERSNGMAKDLNFDRLEEDLRVMVEDCLPSHSKSRPWSNEDDFIHLGMDSLQATRLRRALNASLQRQGNRPVGSNDLPVDFVYRHASISRLAKALRGSSTVQDDRQLMLDLSKKYAVGSVPGAFRTFESVVLLTGSTGNLGAHVLQSLGENPRVARVVCLVRSNSSTHQGHNWEALQQRQESVLKERGIALSGKAWSKLEFLPWSPGESNLGLSSGEYDRLSQQVTDIFHGAWPMDFKRSLSSFEPQLRAVKDLVDLGRAIYRKNARSAFRPKVVFASSIAVVGRFAPELRRNVVPELPCAPESALPMGYAEGKWVCEQIMESAHRNVLDEIQPVILRIGQISGSEATGYWSSQEHVAALVKASQSLGRMPTLEGVS